MLREIKPKNARAARAVTARAPRLVENPKKALFLRSTSTSSLINSITSDLFSLKKPLAARFTKKNAIHPFENADSLEFFSKKNDTSLLCFSSHTKKRPNCITFIRCYNNNVLDMMECLVQSETARTISQFGGPKCKTGTKPLLSFSGPQFADEDPKNRFAVARSILLDFFRGEDATNVDVEGLQMLMHFTAAELSTESNEKIGMIYMRVWRIVTKKSGQKLPRVELQEMGPRIDFRLGRIQAANEATMKTAMKKAKTGEAKVKKNIDTDLVGDKIGRIHIGKQDLSELQTRKMKGLKRGREEFDEEEDSEDDDSNISSANWSDGAVDEDELNVLDDSDENENSTQEEDTPILVKRRRVG